MKRRKLAKTMLLAALVIAYGGVAPGMWLGGQTRAEIDRYRTAIPRPEGTVLRANAPRADDFWEQQGRFSPAPHANSSDWPR